MQTRERIVAGVIYMGKMMSELEFPSEMGFGFTLDLGTPQPKPTGSMKAKASVGPSPAPSPTSTPSPQPADKHGKKKPSADPTPSGPKIDTKVAIFPLDAPAAPTPQPTGDTQSFAQRVPIIRAYMMSQAEIKVVSLASVHFKLPADERPEGRDFSIVVFESRKHRKYSVVASDPEASLDGDTVTADTPGGPFTLKKKTGYLFVLYGDDLEPTPVPRGAYPQPGNNPFNTPGPTVRPGYPQPYGQPTPPYGQPPPPYGQPTPYGAPH